MRVKMGKLIKLYLPDTAIDEILDLLEYRKIVWQATTQYIDAGYTDLSDCVEDCSDSSEAQTITDYHQYLIDTIKNQMYLHEMSTV